VAQDRDERQACCCERVIATSTPIKCGNFMATRVTVGLLRKHNSVESTRKLSLRKFHPTGHSGERLEVLFPVAEFPGSILCLLATWRDVFFHNFTHLETCWGI
jgi:hypothetical protein